MIILLYEITQVIELGIGVYLCKKVYPEWRFENWWWKVLCFIPFLILGLANISNAKLTFISNLWVFFSGIVVAIIYCVAFKANYLPVLLLQITYNINISFLKMPILILRWVKSGYLKEFFPICIFNLIKINNISISFNNLHKPVSPILLLIALYKRYCVCVNIKTQYVVI